MVLLASVAHNIFEWMDAISHGNAQPYLKNGAQNRGDPRNTEYGAVLTRNSAAKRASEFLT